MEYFKLALKKYAEFDGRSTKSEYWYFVLFQVIISLVLIVLMALTNSSIFLLIQQVFSLAMLIPGLAVSVRRLHDVGKSGWMLLLSLIPLAGAIYLIVLFATKSDPGDNAYGPNPNHEISSDLV